MSKSVVLGFLLAALLLSGCARSGAALKGPAPAPDVARSSGAALQGAGATLQGSAPAPDVARGRAVFGQTLIHQTPGCVTCHSLKPGVVVVGPSLSGVGARAEKVLHSAEYKGLASTPAEFLRESILTPQVYLSGGFAHSVMPEWEGVIEREDLNDLVAFLATLK